LSEGLAGRTAQGPARRRRHNPSECLGQAPAPVAGRSRLEEEDMEHGERPVERQRWRRTRPAMQEPRDHGTDKDVRVSEIDRDVGRREARRRYGGLDIPASLAGMLVALALVVILGGIAAAIIGAIGYQVGLKGQQEELSIGAFIAGAVVLFIAFVLGGWAAGRIARYDGGKNGIMTAVWAIILAAILAILGAVLGSNYDVFAKVNLPQWFSSDAFTLQAVITGVVSLVMMLLGGFLGGKWGERFHRRADAVVASTRPGAIRHTRGEALSEGDAVHSRERGPGSGMGGS
jgi:hypothetical protein